MSKRVYLGDRAAFNRLTRVEPPVDPPPPPSLVYPALSVVDPDADVVVVRAIVPNYGDEFEPLREIHAVALPNGAPVPDAETLLSDFMTWPLRASVDVTNVKGQAVELPLVDLPDGSWFVQSVLVAGSD